MIGWRWLVLSVAIFVGSAAASPHEAIVPLREGKLQLGDLSARLLDELHAPAGHLPLGSIDLREVGSSDLIAGLNRSLGDGIHISVTQSALVLHIDREKLPHDVDSAKLAARVFTAVAAPRATADQRRSYGLLMPRVVEPGRRMVVLIHGLDCNRANWHPMAELLGAEGYQVAYFTYASDGPLAESVKMLAREMEALRAIFPELPVSIVAHSMGGLVARGYIEGESYSGGVSHLIMLGTPNQGSRWAAYRIALEAQEHYQLWRRDRNWQPTWMITDGLGEAGRDLKPQSAFLGHLNTLPRTEGVRYTIVAGCVHPIRRFEAEAADAAAGLVPPVADGLGLGRISAAIHGAADKWRHCAGDSDGPVSVSSTELEGVADRVIVATDHNGLYYPVGGQPPAAWEIIRQRLKH